VKFVLIYRTLIGYCKIHPYLLLLGTKMECVTEENNIYQFGQYELHIHSFELHSEGKTETLTPKTFRLLHCLLRSAPEPVPNEVLMRFVWGQEFVSPETITQRVKLLRKLLCDNGKSPEYIGLTRGVGYRMLQEVTTSAAPETGSIENLDQRTYLKKSLTFLKPFTRAVAARPARMASLAIILLLAPIMTFQILNASSHDNGPRDKSASSELVATLEKKLFDQAEFFYHRRQPGDLDRAQELLERALSITPDYAQAWVALAGVYNIRKVRSLGIDPKLAEQYQHDALQRALEINPELAIAHARMARFYWCVGENDKLNYHLEKALELGENDEDVIWLTSDLQIENATKEVKLDHLDKITKLLPTSPLIYKNAIFQYLAIGEANRAEATLNELRDLAPESLSDLSDAQVRIAILQQDYDEALKIATNIEDAVERESLIAIILFHIGQKEASLSTLEQLEQPASYHEHAQIAEANYVVGKKDAVSTLLQQLANNLPTNPHEKLEYVDSINTLQSSPFVANLPEVQETSNFLLSSIRCCYSEEFCNNPC
jgi:DNA-binding winged helix-turn-helix (wHTH) protein/Tfp pilus assembly protein PilF